MGFRISTDWPTATASWLSSDHLTASGYKGALYRPWKSDFSAMLPSHFTAGAASLPCWESPMLDIIQFAVNIILPAIQGDAE